MRPRLVLNSLEKGPRCIMIPIHLKTTDTLEEVNSGATGDFIDEEFVEHAKLPTCRLSAPVLVYNVDGSLNEARTLPSPPYSDGI